MPVCNSWSRDLKLLGPVQYQFLELCTLYNNAFANEVDNKWIIIGNTVSFPVISVKFQWENDITNIN